MIPERFVVEYPERCLKLLEMLEPRAREEELTGPAIPNDRPMPERRLRLAGDRMLPVQDKGERAA
jgi:hypothetical protein